MRCLTTCLTHHAIDKQKRQGMRLGTDLIVSRACGVEPRGLGPILESSYWLFIWKKMLLKRGMLLAALLIMNMGSDRIPVLHALPS
jgi:hypothetical protein